MSYDGLVFLSAGNFNMKFYIFIVSSCRHKTNDSSVSLLLTIEKLLNFFSDHVVISHVYRMKNVSCLH